MHRLVHYLPCGNTADVHFADNSSQLAKRTVKMSIDSMQGVFGVYYYVQIADTLKCILNDIFISIIKEQCSDKEESTRRHYKGCQNTVDDISGLINS